MRVLEVTFGILASVAVVNIVFFAPNSANVIGSVFGGTSNLFGTLTKNQAG